ncbi:hypothetical protein Tco_0122864 [Tanacetum coccineum]
MIYRRIVILELVEQLQELEKVTMTICGRITVLIVIGWKQIISVVLCWWYHMGVEKRVLMSLDNDCSRSQSELRVLNRIVQKAMLSAYQFLSHCFLSNGLLVMRFASLLVGAYSKTVPLSDFGLNVPRSSKPVAG